MNDSKGSRDDNDGSEDCGNEEVGIAGEGCENGCGSEDGGRENGGSEDGGIGGRGGDAGGGSHDHACGDCQNAYASGWGDDCPSPERASNLVRILLSHRPEIEIIGRCIFF